MCGELGLDIARQKPLRFPVLPQYRVHVTKREAACKQVSLSTGAEFRNRTLLLRNPRELSDTSDRESTAEKWIVAHRPAGQPSRPVRKGSGRAPTYCTGVASGWPFSAIMQFSTFAGSVGLMFVALWICLEGLKVISPAFNSKGFS